jgi:sulfatase maturation enzyme AslB (radical SAM superfamily)
LEAVLPELVAKELSESPQSRLWNRFAGQIRRTEFTEAPVFPSTLLVEVANICNHKCSFCAYTKMTRPSQYIDPELFKSIVKQAYDLGAREIGLHGGSEPLTCKKLEEHIAYCRNLGYDYIYFTTNGTLATEERLKRLIDAGVSSIKVSINGGDAETYKKVHGRDDFERVCRNVAFISEYRKTIGRTLYLAVSFVEVPENKDSFSSLKERFAPLVDEIFHVVATNQSGQMMNQPLSKTRPDTCHIPFTQVNITREGYLRACCNDYQNMLVTDDLNKVSLAEAWHGEVMRSLRRRHLEDKLKGSLCYNCVKGCDRPVRPLRPDLADWGQIR